MFQLETEDMLPRMAPKPTAPTPTLGLSSDGATIKPQVPEVSLLFGGTFDPRQQQQQQQPARKEQQPSYADWRKQVSKAAAENETSHGMVGGYPLAYNGYSLSGKSYPVCSTTSTTSATRTLSVEPAATVNGGTSTINNNFQPIASMQSAYRSALPPVFYRRNNDPNEEYMLLPTEIVASTYAPANVANNNTTTPSNKVTHNSAHHEALTICAGTQTDFTFQQISSPSSSSGENKERYASKADVEQLMEIVEHMREDQLRLMQICESLLGMSQQVNLHKQETTKTDCDFRRSTSPLSSHGKVLHYNLSK